MIVAAREGDGVGIQHQRLHGVLNLLLCVIRRHLDVQRVDVQPRIGNVHRPIGELQSLDTVERIDLAAGSLGHGDGAKRGPIERVFGLVAREHRRVLAGAAEDDVVARAADDRVVAAAGPDDIRAAGTVDRLRIAAAGDEVVICRREGDVDALRRCVLGRGAIVVQRQRGTEAAVEERRQRFRCEDTRRRLADEGVVLERDAGRGIVLLGWRARVDDDTICPADEAVVVDLRSLHETRLARRERHCGLAGPDVEAVAGNPNAAETVEIERVVDDRIAGEGDRVAGHGHIVAADEVHRARYPAVGTGDLGVGDDVVLHLRAAAAQIQQVAVQRDAVDDHAGSVDGDENLAIDDGLAAATQGRCPGDAGMGALDGQLLVDRHVLGEAARGDDERIARLRSADGLLNAVEQRAQITVAVQHPHRGAQIEIFIGEPQGLDAGQRVAAFAGGADDDRCAVERDVIVGSVAREDRDIRPVAAVQRIVTSAASELVAACAAAQLVVAGTAVERVVTVVAFDDVDALAAGQHILAGPTGQHVVPRLADDDVIPVARGQHIVIRRALDQDVAGQGRGVDDRAGVGDRDLVGRQVLERRETIRHVGDDDAIDLDLDAREAIHPGLAHPDTGGGAVDLAVADHQSAAIAGRISRKGAVLARLDGDGRAVGRVRPDIRQREVLDDDAGIAAPLQVDVDGVAEHAGPALPRHGPVLADIRHGDVPDSTVRQHLDIDALRRDVAERATVDDDVRDAGAQVLRILEDHPVDGVGDVDVQQGQAIDVAGRTIAADTLDHVGDDQTVQRNVRQRRLVGEHDALVEADDLQPGDADAGGGDGDRRTGTRVDRGGLRGLRPIGEVLAAGHTVI